MVYFIQAGDNGPIKIGYAQTPKDRLKELQTGNHEVLKMIAQIPGSDSLEKKIHDELKVFRYRGEWFCPTPEVLDYIEKIQSVDYEIIDGVPVAILWRDREDSETDHCPFCGKQHRHEEKDGRYEVGCLPGWPGKLPGKRKLLDETIIKQVDGYIIRTRDKNSV